MSHMLGTPRGGEYLPSLEKPRCPVATSLGSNVTGVALSIEQADCSERFSNVLSCGGTTMLLRRVEEQLDIGAAGWKARWSTSLRFASPDGNDFRAPQTTFATQLNLSHNAAFLCGQDGQSIIAYGGQHKTSDSTWANVQYKEFGIKRAVGRVVHHSSRRGGGALQSTIEWSSPELVLDGALASGCVERRVGYEPLGFCEFDGKLSVVRYNGRTLLYARANASPLGNGRHVQVTSSADGVTGWSRWQLLDFDGGVPLVPENNIYFFTPRVLPRLGLGAFFPAVVQGEGGVYFSTSVSGVSWRRPRRVFRARNRGLGDGYRTNIYPVDGGFEAEGGAQATGSQEQLVIPLLLDVGVPLVHGADLKACGHQELAGPSTALFRFREGNRTYSASFHSTHPATVCSYRLNMDMKRVCDAGLCHSGGPSADHPHRLHNHTLGSRSVQPHQGRLQEPAHQGRLQEPAHASKAKEK